MLIIVVTVATLNEVDKIPQFILRFERILSSNTFKNTLTQPALMPESIRSIQWFYDSSHSLEKYIHFKHFQMVVNVLKIKYNTCIHHSAFTIHEHIIYVRLYLKYLIKVPSSNQPLALPWSSNSCNFCHYRICMVVAYHGNGCCCVSYFAFLFSFSLNNNNNAIPFFPFHTISKYIQWLLSLLIFVSRTLLEAFSHRHWCCRAFC